MITYNNNGIAQNFVDSVRVAFYGQPAEDKFMFKVANSPDQEFEQAFFQLAYDKIQEKLFNLLPFLVGFEIVNKNDEGTKALGVFGFKSNNGQTLFIPAFFINGTVKGLDLMYSKNNEQFYPLSEDYAEMFLKDEVTGIGETSKENRNQINSRMPSTDLQNLVRPPQMGKRAEVKHTSLIEFVQDSNNIIKEAFYDLFKENDGFCEAVLRFYPIEKVAKALVLDQVKVAEAKDPEIKLMKLGESLDELSDDQKLEVVKKGYFLLDKRKPMSKSKLGLFKYSETFTNPTESGFYSYVTTRGKLRHALILVKPKQLRQQFNHDEAVIIDLKKGDGFVAPITKIFVKARYAVPDFSEVVNELDEPAEVTPSFDSTYMLVNESLTATEPFKVLANYKGDDGVRVIEVERTWYICEKPHNNSFYNTELAPFTKYKIFLTKKKGDKLEYRGNNIYLPKGFKLLNVDFGKFDEANIPGGLHDINAALRADAVFPFSLTSNGSEYFVSVAESKKKYDSPLSAKIGMVLDIGLDEKVASDLVDSIHYTGAKVGHIKLAYTGENFFALREPSPYANQLGQPTYGDGDGGTYSQVGPQDDHYVGNPTQMGKATMPEVTGEEPQNGQGTSEAINTANQLAQQGQKNIFDTQAIATLSKYVMPQQKTMSYMPEFVSALDKLGRMLFLVYWETEKFEEAYGRTELPEMVELLSNVFKNLGDLVIYLKRKAPELSINMSENEQSTL